MAHRENNWREMTTKTTHSCRTKKHEMALYKILKKLVLKTFPNSGGTIQLRVQGGRHWSVPTLPPAPPPPPAGPNSFIFAYVSAEKCPCQRLAPPQTGRRPLTGNPGSAAASGSENQKHFILHPLRRFIAELRSSEELKRLKEEFNQGPSPGSWYYSK